MMKAARITLLIALCLFPRTILLHGQQGITAEEREAWGRTRTIMDCAPRLVDRRELVVDQFDHRYITTNPRDIEVAYFSVEPITYTEQGRRFCEARLPAAGVSDTYFRGTYTSSYNLPGEGTFLLIIISQALIFNNGPVMINSQDALGEISASHHLEVGLDTVLNPRGADQGLHLVNKAYDWELEISANGEWNGALEAGEFELQDAEIPAGSSAIMFRKLVKGPGVVTVKESVVFRISAISAFKYDPLFQAPCLFSLDPLAVSSRLLPCVD